MITRPQRAAQLLQPGLIAVVRALRRDQVTPLSRALVEGGITAVEVTLTTPEAIEAIAETRKELGNEVFVGVGTVLDASSCRRAIEAGAEFVVSPITRKEILDAAHALERPVMLGAYTPTEAQTAHEMGADFIKIFPADGLGPGYIKALRAPLPHLRIVPTGGVDLTTAVDFLKAGCVALGVGSSLISARILRDNDWPELTRAAREFVRVVGEFRRS